MLALLDRHTQQDAESRAVWRLLFERQSRLVQGRACPEFLAGLQSLGLSPDAVPELERVSDRLERVTGWRLAPVDGFLDDATFFRHLAARRFPVTWWLRPRDKLDYLQEPDLFHDLFGHVPLLSHPIFADYMQAYGEGGLKAEKLGALDMIARLYWYTVEFGLIDTGNGPRIHGAGILSSHGEVLYSLDSPVPTRRPFDLKRILRTRYHIDRYQTTYFVISSFEQLMRATEPDFAPLYREVRNLPEFDP
jgi:phenylalanine-4-hydroxylase